MLFCLNLIFFNVFKFMIKEIWNDIECEIIVLEIKEKQKKKDFTLI